MQNLRDLSHNYTWMETSTTSHWYVTAPRYSQRCQLTPHLHMRRRCILLYVFSLCGDDTYSYNRSLIVYSSAPRSAQHSLASDYHANDSYYSLVLKKFRPSRYVTLPVDAKSLCHVIMSSADGYRLSQWVGWAPRQNYALTLAKVLWGTIVYVTPTFDTVL